MKFSEFLNESKKTYSYDNGTGADNSPQSFKKITPDSLKAVKAVLSKSEIVSAIEKELKDVHFGAPTLVKDTVSVYGTGKEGSKEVAYVQFIIKDEIDEESLKDFGEDQGFEAGDIYYTNWRALFNLKNGKIIDVTREEANDLHTKLSDAKKTISSNVF
jgi:hypothetical protein